MLYLDNSATTPILMEVKEKMLTYLTEEYGNPSGKYYGLAEDAKKAVEEARSHVSQLLGSYTHEVIFTSGATESNNMIVKGVADLYTDKGNHIITTKAEHNSILDICRFLETKGIEVTYLDVDRFGRINIEDVEKAINDRTILISIIWGNNETGSLNPIKEIAELANKHQVLFHIDATQAVGKVEMNWHEHPGISFLSASAHKLFGPKGAGITLIRSNKYKELLPLTPLIHGGGQEHGIRSGTYAVHNIVGLGEAARLAKERFDQNYNRLIELEEHLLSILHSKFGERIILNSDSEDKIPGIINIRFKGLNNEVLLKKLSTVIAASTGSACSSAKPSHVLQAMGLNLVEVRESVRFSLSPYQTKEELDIFNQL
ncbi:aminotransferase class V-fold PLP-dependent enzyme [Bacillus aerolatus]|uniref:Aminotransferase class V-fold PLP-dependent enzyme n=1 Tax=Bacillus aerolatus TaxID=2653354 RepID=A0A6I1FG30_9BACI|nr:cysteine desulfurase family protein [Bacillus aerolatus]KAB7707124.1 aminotransferase class V-fold PLP-dependent enzyme [Bacillus aerolatus]